MPGILPMKLIKCGNSQTRIAQACDRCRSKKIRCDGIRPCCTQCANVGFECKTSDKLSRRAFPRGYTESLEERVRALESEVRELKDLLDQKEEQMEMLSRIHSFSPYSPPPSNASGMPVKKQRDEIPSAPKEECFSMVESYGLMGQTNQNGFFMGPSSGRPFLDVFKQKLLDTNRFSTNFNTDSFVTSPATISISSLSLESGRSSNTLQPPPRVESDHFLVSYFQEYHPLFPVVHRPAFLRFYEKLLKSVENGNPGAGLSKHAIAQLFLIFSIMAEHSDGHDSQDQASYDLQWQRALNEIILDSTLETLQCLVLAQIYCCVRGDYSKLLQYKSLAAGICFRLGLNQNQKKFSLTPLVTEMRKRVFWCAATLDSFSAAMLGQPRLLKSDSIDCELPSDVDDEYVSEKGFLPTIPGDSTKISSALALFRCSSILGRILEKVYEGKNEHSYRVLREMEDELDAWKTNLAPHLRMEFSNGSPATNAIHSRAPLLVLSYHYARILIHRSVIGSGQSNESASVLAIAESSKCIIQIIQLLSERKLGFTFCLNRNQLLVLSGLSVLYSSLDYSQGGGLVKDSQRVIRTVLDELERESCTAAKQFRLISAALSPMEFQQQCSSISSPDTQDFPTSPSSMASTTESHDETHCRRMSGHPVSPKFLNLPPHMLSQPSSNNGNSPPSNTSNGTAKRSSTQETSPQLKSRHARTQSLHTRHPSTTFSEHNQEPMHYPSKYPNPNLSSPDLFLHSIPPPTPNNWPLDTSMPLPQTDDWEQLLSLMDSSHAAHIYGEFVPAQGTNGLIPENQQQWAQGELDMLGQKGYIQDYDVVGSVDSLSTNGSDVEGNYRRVADMGWDV